MNPQRKKPEQNKGDDLLPVFSDHFHRTFEESQPDQRARVRLDGKDSNRGSQSTRGVIGLEISGLLAPGFRPVTEAIMRLESVKIQWQSQPKTNELKRETATTKDASQ